jgi:hypothetical protein
MRQRCKNPRNHKYNLYGARGITVCNEWDVFANFSRDVGPRPSPFHSLDRKDNNGNYEPGNTRWATQIEQQNNRRDNLLLTANGTTKTCAQWARELNLKPKVLRQRIVRDGWEHSAALGL